MFNLAAHIACTGEVGGIPNHKRQFQQSFKDDLAEVGFATARLPDEQ